MSVNFPDPASLLLLLGAVALIPFIAVMATSYVKLVVVFSLVRNALGIQSIPPNMATNGIAIVLTVFIMAPVARESFAIISRHPIDTANVVALADTVGAGLEPFRAFLEKHSTHDDRDFFQAATRRLWPKADADAVTEHDILVLLPAFMVTELTAAFRIGFLLFLPFIVIDLIVSNILLAMGMMMVSPMTISLPFKIFLFVMVDGWVKLIQGLVLSYI